MTQSVKKQESILVGELAASNPRRSLIFLAIGAAAGLLIAGFGLFTAEGTSTRRVPAEDIALVNRRPLLMVDFIAQLMDGEGVTLAQSTKEQRDKVLNAMIREELLVQHGLELDFPSVDTDVRTALVAAVEQQVMADIAAEIPTEEKLQAFYQAHKSGYASEGMMTVRDLVLAPANGQTPEDTIKLAAAGAAALRAGAALQDVAAKFGLKDSQKTKGEEFYFAARAHLGDALFAAAAPLASGQVSEPIADGERLHVLAMEKNTPPVPRSFADAREQVLNDYRRAAQQRVQNADERYLRRKAEILIAPGFE